MRLRQPQLSCTTRASLATAITFASCVCACAIVVAAVRPSPLPVAREDRPLRPVLAWARPTVQERGPPREAHVQRIPVSYLADSFNSLTTKQLVACDTGQRMSGLLRKEAVTQCQSTAQPVPAKSIEASTIRRVLAAGTSRQIRCWNPHAMDCAKGVNNKLGEEKYIMKKIFAIGLLVVGLAFAGLASAATLSWDSSPASDIAKYKIYACETAGCVVVKSSAMFLTDVPHTVGIARQSVVIDLTGKTGTIAVTASDNAASPGPNESGLSVQVPFDQQAPPIPVNPTLQ